MDYYPSLDILRLFRTLKNELLKHEYQFDFDEETFDAYATVEKDGACTVYGIYVDEETYGLSGIVRYYGINVKGFDKSFLDGVIGKVNKILPYGFLGTEHSLNFQLIADKTEVTANAESVKKFIDKLITAANKYGAAIKDLLNGKIDFKAFSKSVK